MTPLIALSIVGLFSNDQAIPWWLPGLLALVGWPLGWWRKS